MLAVSIIFLLFYTGSSNSLDSAQQYGKPPEKDVFMNFWAEQHPSSWDEFTVLLKGTPANWMQSAVGLSLKVSRMYSTTSPNTMLTCNSMQASQHYTNQHYLPKYSIHVI